MEHPDKLLWFGTYVQEEQFDTLLNEGSYVQTAANRVQGYYLYELSKLLDAPIDIISALITLPYPISNRMCFSRKVEAISDQMTLVNTPFTNIRYFSVLSQIRNVCKETIRWCSKNKGKKIWVIVYSIRLPLLEAASIIKKHIPDAVIVNIVPDLPRYMHTEESVIRSLLLWPYESALQRKQKAVDGYVLYSQAMMKALNCSQKNSIVIEGLFNTNIVLKNQGKTCEHQKKQVVYTGALTVMYGVKDLVEAFIKWAPSNVELCLYGTGSYSDELIKMAEKYPFIRYGGLVSPDKAFEVICDADLVVNPRPSNHELTKYSFPSKVFEYMASGTPVLMTKLSGIPNDYYQFVYTIEDETPDGMVKALEMVFSQSEESRTQMGMAARKFILENKSAKNQNERLIGLFEKLSSF